MGALKEAETALATPQASSTLWAAGRYRELATKGSGKTGSQMHDGPFATGAGACAKGDDGYRRAIQRLPETQASAASGPRLYDIGHAFCALDGMDILQECTNKDAAKRGGGDHKPGWGGSNGRDDIFPAGAQPEPLYTPDAEPKQYGGQRNQKADQDRKKPKFGLLCR